ncbi:Fur family transcriptional regulator [Gillisia sp. Hel_I_29]|uniref:Fur family transcriptional regulator n=1 Tax=Gillisia sp. Hel_I_29 TaxID=1249975 RepID=UPI000550A328|nr:transcriptional repressor [Gillisia sp. Hel_I_29]|tara:strand:+ start:2471 stop:2890 length:420 start_codon:yes stop_codon:yes gene_type:complete
MTQNIEDFLETKYIRPTAMRILTFKFLDGQQVATSLTDIEQAFNRSERTTLYRTLKTFEEHGVVHKIDDGSGVTKYALCEENCRCDVDTDLHLHFHCNNCGETVCLTNHKIPQINLPEGYLAEDVNLVVKGICEKCNRF